MKKLIFIFIAFAFLTASLAGQSKTKTANSYVMSAGKTYYEYVPKKTDYIGPHGYDTLYFEILTNKNVPTNCNIRVDVTRAGTTDTYDIDLEGKLFEGSTYAKIIESAANTASKELADTTRTSLTQSPAGFFRYYRIVVNNDNAIAATDSLIINKVSFKLYER
jgi:hypothetical protein